MGKCIICGKETDKTIYVGSACHYAYVCEKCQRTIQKVWKKESKE